MKSVYNTIYVKNVRSSHYDVVKAMGAKLLYDIVLHSPIAGSPPSHPDQPSNLTTVRVKRILKDDGIMILTIPNINSVQFRLFKEKCFHLDIPRHLYHYSMETIEKMLSKARFRAANIKHLSFEFLSLEFLRGPYKTLVKLFREKGSPKLVCNFLAIMVTPLTSFLSIANSLLGNGEIMDVYCAKARNIKR